MKSNALLPSLILGLIAVSKAGAAEPFALRDGDRVVLVGSTLIEREQRYGYWETALTRRYPDKSIIFRNLGWSGDTVFGDARAGFGTQADGFRHLKDHVLALKPTVIFIGYGTNESFDGKKGLPRFVKGLETLLDTFAPTKARIVLLSPLKQENLGPPLPDPTENNKNLRLYADAIKDVAKKQNHRFIDFYTLLSEELFPLTDNGIHLTAYGYWRSASYLEDALGLPEATEQIEINTKGEVKKIKPEDVLGIPDANEDTEIKKKGELKKPKMVRVDEITTAPLRFRAMVRLLPLPVPPKPKDYPDPSVVSEIQFTIHGLAKKSSYIVSIDGKSVSKHRGDFCCFPNSADLQQAERLRQTIVAKNRLYFYRWRPENETYLFGFRKHEQGQNAREIPQFDPLVADKEKEIAKLRVPAAHTYEIKVEKKP